VQQHYRNAACGAAGHGDIGLMMASRADMQRRLKPCSEQREVHKRYVAVDETRPFIDQRMPAGSSAD
jgi:hypothetical protein